jgi:hypothetical protein
LIQKLKLARHAMFKIDVAEQSVFAPASYESCSPNSTSDLLRQLVAGQLRQNQLLEDLIEQMGAVQRQRQSELGQWKEANPHLAERCRTAAESLARVQANVLETLADEVNENSDSLMEGEFMLAEFVDRFGPRLAHLNGVLQILTQLSSVPNPANTQ